MKISYWLIGMVLLFTAHLLLAGLLLGAILQRLENQRYNLAFAGVGLAMLLLAWVGALLVQRLWQRRWVVASALAVLLLVDGLALCGGVLLTGVIGVTPDG
ncbi:hypothetical protein [Hymenobacter arizonensis]|uniref:Uncharacterized protein n=1 Tax=Hymenobacter arizonensis TaxID=1227077 RepID=A0A1I6BEH4_HYMAR|nr:hypothetical protein [Hymenobacter arizonensis]SFQ79306.1 hypothetical protein SAMN04515668_4425 [Hymenobacter arizonensis]